MVTNVTNIQYLNSSQVSRKLVQEVTTLWTLVIVMWNTYLPLIPADLVHYLVFTVHTL